MSDPSGPDPEVERLRAEVDDLRGRLQTPDTTVELPVEQRTRRGWWRPVLATVLIVVMAVLAPLSVLAMWAHDEISDTDRYVESVAPLAKDPAIQEAVADKITTEITTRLKIQEVTDQAVAALSQRGLPPLAATSLKALSTPLASAIEEFVHRHVTTLVESDEFAQAWETANREAHTQLVAVLTGKDSDTVEVTDNAVKVNLATVVDSVKQRLVADGFTLAERLPEVNAEFTIFQSSDIGRAQTAFRLLGAVATLLPILALLCLAGAVAVGRSRRRTLIAAALALAASMLLLGVALNAFRLVYLDAVPTDELPTDAAAAVYDTLVWFIRLNLRAVLVLSLVVAFIAWVTGPERAPVAVRRTTGRAVGLARHGSERAGLDTGPLGVFLDTYKRPLRGAVLGIALLFYVLQDHPTGGTTIWLVVVTAVVLLIIEILARPPAVPAVPAADAAPPPADPGPP